MKTLTKHRHLREDRERADKIREAVISDPMTDWDRVFWEKKIWMKPLERMPIKTQSDLIAEAITADEPLPRHRRLRVEELARRWDSVKAGIEYKESAIWQ
jgi:hypothetical protein